MNAGIEEEQEAAVLRALFFQMVVMGLVIPTQMGFGRRARREGDGI